MKADLHLHSTFSDGINTPEELVAIAAEAGLDLIALTDHDSLDGAARLQHTAIPVLQGVELSLNDRHGLHLLCYGLQHDTALHRTVKELAQKRLNRADIILERCREHGMPLRRERVNALAGGTVGRPHIALAMIEAGYVSSMNEAFDRWLGDDRPCYAGGERLSIAQAIPLALQSGFVPVLAHPWETADTENDIRTLVRTWASLGLMGIEVYHPSAAAHGFSFLDRLARDSGLLVTGGSDFHRPNDKHGAVGCMSACWRTCTEDLAALKTALTHRAAISEKGGGT